MRRLRSEAEALVLPRALVSIQGSDRDAGAIEAARANAARAGVSGDVDFSTRAISAIAIAPTAATQPRVDAGLIVANPPYGVRVGERAPLRDLYAQFGKVLRARFPGWTVAVLAADERLGGQLRLDLAERLRTVNGGIPVRLLVGAVPGDVASSVTATAVRSSTSESDSPSTASSNPATGDVV
jgi:putative N6-adenine-specific DNA methylase